MTQATTRIEDVWAAKGNLPLAPAILDSTGGLDVDHFNYPNLTTSELDAVTDAAEGDVYFDSDRKQFVRFTGAASYDVITSRAFVADDSLSPTAAITLAEARFFESGLITETTNGFAPDSLLTIFDDDEFSSGAGTTYQHSDGNTGLAVGWISNDNIFGGEVTGDVVISGNQYRLSLDVQGANIPTLFSFNQIVASDVTDKQIASVPLEGGSEYKIEVVAPVGDLAVGNLRFDVGYTGLYADGTVEITCDDLVGKNRILYLKYKLTETDIYIFTTGTKLSTNSPRLAIYTFTFIIRPSSDGVFTMSARQTSSNVDPLLIGKAQTTVTLMTS